MWKVGGIKIESAAARQKKNASGGGISWKMEIFCKSLRTRKFSHGILTHSGFRKCSWLDRASFSKLYPLKVRSQSKTGSVTKNRWCNGSISLNCLEPSLTLYNRFEIWRFLRLNLVRHILKAYYESYSKIIRGHKYKDKDNDQDNDKDTDKAHEKPNICYIFEILMTYSFQIWW